MCLRVLSGAVISETTSTIASTDRSLYAQKPFSGPSMSLPLSPSQTLIQSFVILFFVLLSRASGQAHSVSKSFRSDIPTGAISAE